MTIQQAIKRAEQILPGKAASKGKKDPRWKAIIAVGEFIESNPLEVWDFAHRWGRHRSVDLRMAVSTCLVEHLLEHHFDLIFPKVKEAVHENKCFADTFCGCWKFGQAEKAGNARRFDRLEKEAQEIRREATR